MTGRTRMIHRTSVLAMAACAVLGSSACPQSCPLQKRPTDDTIPVDPPIVNKIVSRTGQSPITVKGRKSAGLGIRVMLGHETEARVLVEAEDPKETWEGLVPLAEGLNELSFFAVESSGRYSEPVGPKQVTLDTTGPCVPTVDPYDGFRPLNGAASVTVTLTGRKCKEGNLLVAMRKNDGAYGAEVQKAGLDEKDTWSFTETLTEGTYAFRLRSVDDLGNQGEPSGDIGLAVYSSLPPPTLNPVTSPTNRTPQRISGTKPAGATLWLRRNSNTPDGQVEVVSASNSSAWEADLSLVEGTNTFYLVLTSAGEESPPARGEIVLDTTPPNKPIIQQPQSPATSSTITVQVRRDADAALYVRLNQQPPPTQPAVAANGSADVTVPVDLQNGTNAICMSARDAAGNDSGEACVTVERAQGPAVRILSPLNNGTIKGQQVQVSVEVVGYVGTSTEVASVRVAVDAHGGDAQRVQGTNQWTWSWPIPTGDPAFAEGSTHTIKATATSTSNISTEERITVVYSNTVFLVSNTSVASVSHPPRMVLDHAGVVHVVWADECVQFGYSSNVNDQSKCHESQAGNYPFDIFHRAFTPSTGAWSPIKLISNSAGDGDSREPAVAVDKSGNVHVVWVESGNLSGKGNDRDIVHRVLDVASNTLGDVEVLTTTTTDELTPAIAASANGTIHVVWDSAGTTYHQIMLTSRSGTDPWTTPVVVSNNSAGDSKLPAVGADSSGCAHVVWQDVNRPTQEGGPDADIWYSKVCAGNVGARQLVSDNGLDADSRLPAVAVDADANAMVVWKDTGNIQGVGGDGDIWLRKISAGGQLGAYSLASRSSATESFAPTVAVAPGNRVVVVWSERNQSVTEPLANVMYNVTYSGSEEFFQDGIAVTNTHGPSRNPTIAIDAVGNMHIAWQDLGSVAGSGDDTDIFYVGAALP